MADQNPDEVAKIVGDILVAYLSTQTIDPKELPDLARRLRAAVLGDAPPSSETTVSYSAQTKPNPAVPIEQSVTPDYLISLEDGGKYRSLKRHLKAQYGMTPQQYRDKWGLSPDYPMVASALSEKRSKLARETRLGKGARKSKSVPF